MKNSSHTLRRIVIAMGFLSVALFVYDLTIFFRLQPKMVASKPLTGLEENLITWAGVGLIVILLFFLLSLLCLVRYLKDANEIQPLMIFLIIAGVVSLLFVFGDVALLSDIHKQYRHGLAQPEWTLLYPIIAGQLLVALIFTFLHLSGFFVRKRPDQIVRDINVFLVVQYVGLVCGWMGLTSAGLGFVYRTAYNPLTHVVLTGIVFLFPYALAVLYWLMIKLREKERQWFDEKQLQDLGKSALLTLLINTVYMTALFIFNLQDLAGVVRLVWLPLHLFGVIFLFSLGNLWFSKRI